MNVKKPERCIEPIFSALSEGELVIRGVRLMHQDSYGNCGLGFLQTFPGSD